MKTIEGFMSEITDEFKIVVVDAIRTLCLKFPSKQATMVNEAGCPCARPSNSARVRHNLIPQPDAMSLSPLPQNILS